MRLVRISSSLSVMPDQISCVRLRPQVKDIVIRLKDGTEYSTQPVMVSDLSGGYTAILNDIDEALKCK